MIKKIPIVFKVAAANGLVTNFTVEIDAPQKDEDVSTEVNIPNVGPVKFNCHVTYYLPVIPSDNGVTGSGANLTIDLYMGIKLFERVVYYSGKLKTIQRDNYGTTDETRVDEHTLYERYEFMNVSLDEFTIYYPPDHPLWNEGRPWERTTDVECEIQITLREWTYLPVKGRYDIRFYRSPTNGLILRDGD